MQNRRWSDVLSDVRMVRLVFRQFNGCSDSLTSVQMGDKCSTGKTGVQTWRLVFNWGDWCLGGVYMLHRENKAILPLTFLNGQDVRSSSIVGFASALIINDPPMPPPLNGGVLGIDCV